MFIAGMKYIKYMTFFSLSGPLDELAVSFYI